MKKIEFAEQMKILTMAYSNDYTQQELELWYEYFVDVDYNSFKNAVKEIIKINKYKPSISELLEKCEKQKESKKLDILLKMKADGYFKTEWEYEKALHWLEIGIIPSWFKEDMKKYNQLMIENKQLLLN